SEKVFISMSSITSIPSNAKYLRFRTSTTLVQNNLNAKFQVEVGTGATTYEDPQHHQITILSDVQLEKVGDVADRIIEKNGVWGIDKLNIRNILDKSLTVVLRTDRDLPNNALFEITLPNLKVVSYSNTVLTCNLVPSNTECLTNDVEGVYQVASTNKVLLRISKAKASTVDGVKDYFINNNGFILSNQQVPTFIPLPDAQQVALRTFNNKTNISFLCEVEGTVKGSVPKSTSASINSINTRLDDVDKDLERVKKLEDATMSEITTDSDFVCIDDTANGYLTDVKLEGRTLVNKVTNGNFANGTTGWSGTGATISASNNVLTATGTGGAANYSAAFQITEIPATVGKKVFVKCTARVLDNVCARLRLLVQGSTSGSITSLAITPPVQNTWYTIYGIVDTGTLVGNVRVTPIAYYDDATIATDKVMEVKDVMALDLTALGMANYSADEVNSMLNGYFEGLKSVGQDVNEIVVSSVCGSGNLFDGELELGTLNTDGSIGVITDRTVNKNYVRVIGGKAFYLSNSLNYAISRIAVYDKDKRFIQIVTNGTTFPSNAVYCKFCLLGASLTNNVQLEVGTVATSYKSIETDKKEILYLDTVDNTWKKPTLRGIWSNGALVVGDTIEKHADGKYYYHKRCGEVVLDSSEASWSFRDTLALTNSNVFQVVISGIKSITSNTTLVCDKFNVTTSIYSTDVEGMYSNTNYALFRILKTKCTDLATFKTWLASNNTTLVYPLAVEQVYECTPLDLASYDSETNYTLESGVLSPRSTVKCTNYIGNVVNTLKEKISILEDTVYQTNLATFVLGLNVLNQQV
ncbi:hypothetical protein, partial [Romboutsia sp.]|uniref:hypothetical protein n=1 Tax=Romboutsia sp. TaxID=1965302 RepID=UPI002BE51C69